MGNADPQALSVAVNAALAVERLGMPEARIVLSQAVTYVASAPKSNAACMAIDEAESAVRSKAVAQVPVHLQDRHYKGAEKLGRGLDYKYAHDYPNHYVKQQYLPDGLEGSSFYRPSDNGSGCIPQGAFVRVLHENPGFNVSYLKKNCIFYKIVYN